MTAKTTYRIIHLNGHRVAVAEKGVASFIEAEALAEPIGVRFVLFRDKDGVWRLWQDAAGPRRLDLGGVPTTERDVALAVASARYIR